MNFEEGTASRVGEENEKFQSECVGKVSTFWRGCLVETENRFRFKLFLINNKKMKPLYSESSTK